MRDRLREMIEDELVVERIGWAAEQVARIDERLQRDAAAAERFETLVVWISEHTAFTGAGRTIYLSRRLLEQLPDDDAVAFVIAHELAHHRLGHVPATARGWALLPLRLAMMLLHRVCGPEREHDADRLAIELCLDAGYDPERCIRALESLAQVVLDYGDIDGALGSHDEQGWIESRRRGYHSVADRIAAVRAHVVAVARGARLDVEMAARQARRRRRERVLVAAGGAAVALALVALRRRP